MRTNQLPIKALSNGLLTHIAPSINIFRN